MKCSRCGLEIQGEDEFANYGATQTHFVGSCLKRLKEYVKALEAEIAALKEQAASLAESIDEQQARANERGAKIAKLIKENAALREDKARLDRLERELTDEVFPMVSIEYNEYGSRISFTYRDADSKANVTDSTLRGALDKAFARLDAARKGGAR